MANYEKAIKNLTKKSYIVSFLTPEGIVKTALASRSDRALIGASTYLKMPHLGMPLESRDLKAGSMQIRTEPIKFGTNDANVHFFFGNEVKFTINCTVGAGLRNCDLVIPSSKIPGLSLDNISTGGA